MILFICTIGGTLLSIILLFINLLDLPLCQASSGCSQVLSSPFSTIFGFPISTFSWAYFMLQGLILNPFKNMKGPLTPTLCLSLLLGFLGLPIVSFYLFLQAFVLQSVCYYCLGIHFLFLSHFIGLIYLFKKETRSLKLHRKPFFLYIKENLLLYSIITILPFLYTGSLLWVKQSNEPVTIAAKIANKAIFLTTLDKNIGLDLIPAKKTYMRYANKVSTLWY